MSKVLFKWGTQAQYDALVESGGILENAIYYLYDSHRMYRGDVLFSIGQEATQEALGLMTAEDKIKLDSLTGGGAKHTAIERIRDHLYEITYDTYDYEDGYAYYRTYDPTEEAFGCSEVGRGNLVGRNFDWYYADTAEFVIWTKPVAGRHATLGVAYGSPDLTDLVAQQGNEQAAYKILPFRTDDLINDQGLYIGINVVPNDYGVTTGTGGGDQDIAQNMLVRYLGDYADNAKHAIELMKGMNVYCAMSGVGDEIHMYLKDANDSYIVEWIDNEMEIHSITDSDYDPIPNGQDIMTNFYIHGWNGGTKIVPHGYTEEETEATGLADHACGIERYDILSEHYRSINDVDSMKNAMQAVKYTNAYASPEEISPEWCSEFLGDFPGYKNITIYSDRLDLDPIFLLQREAFANRSRQATGNDRTWQTAHLSVYDIEKKTLNLWVEEDYNKMYEFKLHVAGEGEAAEGVLEWGSI